MNLRTFFSLLFIISIALCIGAEFFPDIIINLFQRIDINTNIKFIGLMSLITSIFSFIGMLFSFYFARKREQRRIQKLEEDRQNIADIHAELESIREKDVDQ